MIEDEPKYSKALDFMLNSGHQKFSLFLSYRKVEKADKKPNRHKGSSNSSK
jgi:hypothetical protein